MTERNIAIGIDSTKAETGGRVVKRNLEEIGNAAIVMEKKVDSANISIARMATGANDNLKRVSQSAQAAGGNLGRLQSIMQGLGSIIQVTIAGLLTMAGILATIAAASVVGGFVKLSDAFKNMTSQLRLVTSSTTELIAVQEQLFQVAQRTRSSYESTTTLYARLARSASSLGLSQKDLLQITENINKTFLISGASAEESANAIRQLAQGLASGALRGDEFNSVAEQAPRLMQILAESLGMTTGQLRAFAGEGKITADIITKALLGATGKLSDEFNKMGVTIGQAMTVLGNSILRAVGQMDAALGISDAIAKAIIGIATAIDNLTTTLSAAAPYLAIFATGLAVAFGPQIIVSVGALALAIGGTLVNAIAAVSSALVALSLSNPFTALLLAITVAVTAVYHFRDEINKALGIDVVQIAKDAANLIIGSFVAAWEDIKALWDAFPDMLGAAFVAAVNLAIEQINRLIGAFTGAIDIIINGLNKIPGTHIEPFGDKGQIDTYFNHYLIALELAIKDRNKLVSEALSTDWVGKITRIFTPSEPGTTPGLPTATTTKTPTSTQSDEMKKNYDELVKGAENSVRALQSEQQALQMTGYAASVFREQQDLINAALAKGIQLTPQQTANLKALGEQMAALKSTNAASSILQDQQASIGRLQLERQLISASTAEREKALAVYDAEQNMIRQGIDLNTQQAAAIRANAAAMAQLKLENERVTAAYSTIQQTGASAIDTLVQGATTVGNNWKDTFRNILQSFVNTFTQLAVANPLKNALLGTNLPTIQDLFSGKSSATFTPGTTTTGTMTVTAGTVMVNGGMMPGIPSTIAGGNTTLGAFLGVPGAVTNGVRPTLTNNGITNSPVAAAAVNGVRPDLIGSGIVNSPVATNQNIPTNNIEQYIRTAAIQRGIDPDIAVKVANSEGGVQSWNQQSLAMRNGIQEPSYGPFQLLKGGQGTGYPVGLGNDFMNKTGLDPALAANGPAGVDFALDHASRNGWGAWYGANKVGVSKWDGIGPRPASNDNAALPNLDQANQSLAKLSTSSMKASTDVSSLSTGADTAAKALSTSSQSVTTSASSLATTTAQIPQQTSSLFSTMTSSIGSGFSGLFSGIGSIFSGLFADGAAFKNGKVTPFAGGGIVSRPTLFPMANGVGLMGERGPEAIMPLRRGPDGKLGVAMHGGVSTGGQQMGSQIIKMETTIKVEGVGDKDLLEKIHAGVDKQMGDGFKRFSREELPNQVRKVQNDKWARG